MLGGTALAAIRRLGSISPSTGRERRERYSVRDAVIPRGDDDARRRVPYGFVRMQLMAAPTTAQRVLAGLAQRRERLVSDVVSEASSIRGYAELEQSQSADFAQTVREGLDAILRAMSDGRAFADDDVAFLWPHIRRRTEAGVSEGDMLAVVRLFQRAVWDAITELAGDSEDGRAATLILARPLIDYIDVLSRVVDRAFVEAEEAISSRASAVRQEVADVLLSGGSLAPGSQENGARRAGLAQTGQ